MIEDVKQLIMKMKELKKMTMMMMKMMLVMKTVHWANGHFLWIRPWHVLVVHLVFSTSVGLQYSAFTLAVSLQYNKQMKKKKNNYPWKYIYFFSLMDYLNALMKFIYTCIFFFFYYSKFYCTVYNTVNNTRDSSTHVTNMPWSTFKFRCSWYVENFTNISWCWYCSTRCTCLHWNIQYYWNFLDACLLQVNNK